MTRVTRSWVAAAACLVCWGASSAVGATEEAMVISNGDTVLIDFTLTLADGTPVVSTKDQVPLRYVQGKGEIMPGLETALQGTKVGDHKNLRLSPDEGFGPRDDAKKLTIERQKLPEHAKVGDFVRLGESGIAMVAALDDQKAVMDLNHPLAGKELVVDVTVVDVNRGPVAGPSESPGK